MKTMSVRKGVVVGFTPKGREKMFNSLVDMLSDGYIDTNTAREMAFAMLPSLEQRAIELAQ